MTPDDILKAFDNIRVWQRGGRRAPHKPLLILMALGRLARGGVHRVLPTKAKYWT